jgi:tetratricopeptide (TPR) repeat protein
MPSLRFVHKHLVTALLLAGILTGCSREGKISGLLQKADTHFKAGNYDTARIEYLNVLHLDAQNERAIQQLGTIWFEDGAPLRALPFLRKIKDLRPTNLDARVELAKILVSLGDASNASKEAQAILDADPTNGEAIILLAETSRIPKELDETAQRFQRFDRTDNPSKYLTLAALSTRKGDLNAADVAIQHALTLDTKSVSVHLAKAELLLLKGQSAQAALELRTVADLAPLRSTARLKYADFEADTGHLANANRILKEITTYAPDYLPAWSSLAKIAYKQKSYDDSLALLENIFNRDPMNPEGRLLQSDVLLAKGDVKSALQVLDRLNTAFPQLPITKYQLARAYLQNDNPTQAIVELNKALSLNPDYLDATLLLGEADLRAGDPQAVVTSMQGLLNKHPNLAPARELLAAAYKSLGQLDDAANTFRDQITASPSNAQPYIELGLILRRQGKLPEARNAFEKAQQLDPQNPAPVEQLVDLDIASKDFSGALQRVQNQWKGNPGSRVAHFLEAKIYFAQRQWDSAETELLKALQLDPNDSKANDLLIYTCIAANKLPDALSRVNSLLSRQPDNERMLMLSGLIYEKLNQFTNARDAYEKLLSLEPRFEAALNNLAWLYAEKFDQLDKACDLAQKARALEPGAGAIADTLGWILYKRGDYGQALSELKDAAAKLPNNSHVQFHLGMAYYMMGQVDQARVALRRAVSDPSDFPAKHDAERKLALLGNGSSNTPPPSVAELEGIVKQQPDDIVAQLLLGDAYEKLGQFANAAQAYSGAVKINQQLLPAYIRLAKLYAGPLGDKEKADRFASKVRDLAPSDGG